MIAISGQFFHHYQKLFTNSRCFHKKETEMLPKARYLYILYLYLSEYSEAINHTIDSNPPNTKIPDYCPISGQYLCQR
jgi:hypothetical protein